MDVLVDHPVKAKAHIFNIFEEFNHSIALNYQNSFLIQTYFDAKADEIKQIFSDSSSSLKTYLNNILKNIQPNRIWFLK